MLADFKYVTPSNVHMHLGAEKKIHIGKCNEIRFSLKSLIHEDTVCCCITSGSLKQQNKHLDLLDYSNL